MLAKITSELGKPAGLVVLSREEALERFAAESPGPDPRDRAEDGGPSSEGWGSARWPSCARAGPARRSEQAFGPRQGRWLHSRAQLRRRDADHRRARDQVAVDRDHLRRRRRRPRRAGGATSGSSPRSSAGGCASASCEGRTIGIKVRLDDWTNVTRSHTVEEPTNDPAVVGPIALDLLRAYDPPRPVRLLGVRLASFESEAPRQTPRPRRTDQLQLGLTA